MELLSQAVFLSVVANNLIDGILEPIRKRYPGIDLWYVIYITWLFGGVLAWFSGINLFEGVFANPLVGKILTSVTIGGGSKLLHDLFDKRA